MRLSSKVKTYQRGMRAEKLAALWLRLKGYKILEQRYKTAVGEIDLIVSKNNLIAFVEVKTRPTINESLESITPKMKSRITRTAQHYLSQNNHATLNLRFDVVAVTPFKIKRILYKPFFIHHLDNAWASSA